MSERDTWIDLLKKLRLQQCAYSPNFHGEQAKRCDCKFHKNGERLQTKNESSNGCPELLWIITHIEGMTDKQFADFSQWPLKRKKRRTKAVAGGVKDAGHAIA